MHLSVTGRRSVTQLPTNQVVVFKSISPCLLFFLITVEIFYRLKIRRSAAVPIRSRHSVTSSRLPSIHEILTLRYILRESWSYAFIYSFNIHRGYRYWNSVHWHWRKRVTRMCLKKPHDWKTAVINPTSQHHGRYLCRRFAIEAQRKSRRNDTRDNRDRVLLAVAIVTVSFLSPWQNPMATIFHSRSASPPLEMNNSSISSGSIISAFWLWVCLWQMFGDYPLSSTLITLLNRWLHTSFLWLLLDCRFLSWNFFWVNSVELAWSNCGERCHCLKVR